MTVRTEELFRGMRQIRKTRASGIHVRSTPLGKDLVLEGYAAVFDVPYEVWDWLGEYTEEVDPEAFDKTLRDKSDVRLLVNHEGLPLARTKSGTLKLVTDHMGLHVEARLDASDPDVQRLDPKIRRGDLREMSFAFAVPKGGEWWNDDYTHRRLIEVELYDVSVVTWPANPQTSVDLAGAVRALASPVSEELLVQLRSADPVAVEQARDLLELLAEDRPGGRAPKGGHVMSARSARQSSGPRSNLQIVREPLTYERGGTNSFVRDMYQRYGGSIEARDRLVRHDREIAVEAERRVRQGELHWRDLAGADGTGGEFTPPMWVIEEFAGTPRATRVVAELVGSKPLPRGVDAVPIPRATAGAAVGMQNPGGGAVQETDMTTTSVQLPIRTVAGQTDAALQILEQGPNFDELLFADLMEDFDEKLEAQLINGSGAAGQLLGILQITGLNAVTYTDASPTVPEFYPKAADGVNRIHTNRKRMAQVHLLHGRRWNWMMAALDAQSRPLAVPNPDYRPVSAIAEQVQAGEERIAGTLVGLPAALSDQVPTNLGAGTNEDIAITFRPADCRLWESSPRTRISPEPLAGNITVRLSFWEYVAFTAGRYPAAISTVGGTGMVPPVF
jgi:HK97 family phage prohead protease/HK97 family phage major capsid protein